MIPEWGSVKPPGFPATMGTPVPEQVVQPLPQPRGRQQLGREERAAQLLPHRGAESPLPLGHRARGSVDPLTPSSFSGNSLQSGAPGGFLPGTPPGSLGRQFSSFGMSQPSCLLPAIPLASRRALILASSSTPQGNRSHLAVALWQ